jgi:hypothetical protein
MGIQGLKGRFCELSDFARERSAQARNAPAEALSGTTPVCHKSMCGASKFAQ